MKHGFSEKSTAGESKEDLDDDGVGCDGDDFLQNEQEEGCNESDKRYEGS